MLFLWTGHVEFTLPLGLNISVLPECLSKLLNQVDKYLALGTWEKYLKMADISSADSFSPTPTIGFSIITKKQRMVLTCPILERGLRVREFHHLFSLLNVLI